ncbi:hypothetical protein MJG53_010369 [Ovis ammon polii x Ovis aries]|uniref:Uncharacterized protein n=1 Tax=Ovis ammon polii x Ovis aries TaxID=2918886 RepID=A0ACB9UTK1_9CETA|nr:hypothetical protein MJG53_010369 [Ovis ammon polii x Ovis aries]
MARLLGCAVAVVLILSVAFTVFFLYHRQQKNRLEMDGGGTALPLSQEPEPSPSRQSHLALEDIQTLGLELEKQQLQQEEDEPQKLPPQPAYYDLGASPSYHPLMLLYASPEEEPHPASRPYHPDLQNPQFPPSFSPFLCSLEEKLIEKFSLDFRFSGNPNFALGKRLLMPFSSFLYKGQVLSAKIEFVVQVPSPCPRVLLSGDALSPGPSPPIPPHNFFRGNIHFHHLPGWFGENYGIWRQQMRVLLMGRHGSRERQPTPCSTGSTGDTLPSSVEDPGLSSRHHEPYRRHRPPADRPEYSSRTKFFSKYNLKVLYLSNFTTKDEGTYTCELRLSGPNPTVSNKDVSVFRDKLVRCGGISLLIQNTSWLLLLLLSLPLLQAMDFISL